MLQGCLCQLFLFSRSLSLEFSAYRMLSFNNDLSGFKSRIKSYLLTVGSLWTDFLYDLTFLCFFFLTLYLSASWGLHGVNPIF